MTRVISAQDPDALITAADSLRQGRIIAIPTETVYGLAVLPQEAAVARLIAAKRRSADKGIQLLVDSVDQARQVALLTPAAKELATAFWPGGLTIVLARREDARLPELIGGGRPTVGVRLPDHAVPRALSRLLGPLAASSANVSGLRPAITAHAVVNSLGAEVDVVIDGGSVVGGIPSTVVDCSDPSVPPKILREGAIAASEISRIVG